jgi:hypothetical protein
MSENKELAHAHATGLGADHSPVVTPGAEIGRVNISPAATVIQGSTAVAPRSIVEHPHIKGVDPAVSAAILGHPVHNTPGPTMPVTGFAPKA